MKCDKCGYDWGNSGDSAHACGFYQTLKPLEKSEQEPVALEAVYETIIHWDEGGGKRSRRELARRIVSLYTTPPPVAEPHKRPSRSDIKPLTDEECDRLAKTVAVNKHQIRAIEAAHGIKGEA